MMGSPEKEPFRNSDESPQHEVELSPSSWLSWRLHGSLLGILRGDDERRADTPGAVYQEQPKPSGRWYFWAYTPFGYPDRGWGQGDRPAITMTHYAAETFCQWLSAKTGKKYRLPTEAEWECAARGGSESAYFFRVAPNIFRIKDS